MIEKQGLTSDQAIERLKKDGFNELPSAKPRNLLKLVKQVMQEPMFLLLISCGVLYLILGDFKEGIVLMSSILVIIFITFYQYRKTERALDALKNLSSPRALVLRDGTPIRIPGREVVCGDLLILQEGDRISADALLIESNNLTVDESLLTGESISINKQVNHFKSNLEIPGGGNDFNVFAGTMIQSGQGKAIVLATGINSYLGKIGFSLKVDNETETRLQQELKILVKRFGILGISISIAVFILYYLSRGNLINALLSSLSSAMAILPEEFPVVMTVFLALGAWRISRKNVLTRKSAAIESLGSATVLCSDKTGTITLNKMTVAAMLDHKGNLWTRENSVMPETLRQLLMHGAAACIDQPSDQMERAITRLFSAEIGKSLDSIVKAYPISSARLAMTTIRQGKSETLISCKGAVEAVTFLCKLSDSEKAKILLSADHLATKGLRVIAVSGGRLSTESIPDLQDQIEHHFLGLIALEDPVRPEVPQAMNECREAGIKVMMITGDYPPTAKSIGSQIGLDHDLILTGKEISIMEEDTLKEALKKVRIFARVLPEQKLKIVEALKSNGEIVAMTGDGINDAPALKAAHIGIAMGKKGTDVAREASSLVLLDDNFASIVSAIKLGRRIYDNLQKAMMYILAIHIPIVGLTLLPALIPGIPFLLFPLHIVFMELIIDPVCSIAFEGEPDEEGLMTRPPRNLNAEFFGKKNMIRGLLNGTLVLLTVLAVYYWSITEGHSEDESRAIAFSCLILSNVGFILSSLSRSRNFMQVLGERNPSVKIILGFAVSLLVLIMALPSVRSLFGFEVPEWQHFLVSMAGSAALVLILESLKFRYLKKLIN